MNELAEEQLFLVAYPAQAQSANPSKCWNWFSAGDQIRDRGEPSLIAGITREIMHEFPVGPEWVYVAGLSAGGAAAAIMGSTYPDLYAAVGVHSGLACGAARDMPSAFTAMKQGASPVGQATQVPKTPIPTIVFHGDRDATVHPVNADQVASQVKGAMKSSRDTHAGRHSRGGALQSHRPCSPGWKANSRAVGGTRRRACVVGRKQRWILHRSPRSRRKSGNGALLPCNNQKG